MNLRNSALLIVLLGACASKGASVDESASRIEALAAEKVRGARFPVLTNVPGRAPAAEGMDPRLGAELRDKASVFADLAVPGELGEAGVGQEATVAELRALLAQVQSATPRVKPRVDLEALGFPTPPPLD